jgi:hypothetical protein
MSPGYFPSGPETETPGRGGRRLERLDRGEDQLVVSSVLK